MSNGHISMVAKKLLVSSFYDYFVKKKFNETEHFILDRLFPDERRITSVMAGLQTSLGSYWERLAVELATKNGFNSLSTKLLLQPSLIPEELVTLIEATKSKRERRIVGNLDNLKVELVARYKGSLYKGETESIQKGRGCDLIFEKNGHVYIIDTKTVQVNAGNGNTYSENLIRWICYYSLIYGHDAHRIHPKIVFPYNSSDHSNDLAWWNDYKDRIAPLTSEDVWVGNEFWSFITGNNSALTCISDAINSLMADHDFVEIYKRSFSIVTKEETTQFRKDLKKFRIKAMRDVELLDEKLVSGKRLRWKHGECYFNSNISQLLKPVEFTCPSCGEVI